MKASAIEVILSDGCACACCSRRIMPGHGASLGRPSFTAPAVNVCAICLSMALFTVTVEIETRSRKPARVDKRARRGTA
jgi:hypothetical protein